MAYDFVNKLEGGIDADAGAIGGHLSGGQKQRIAIARALINKPDLLVFDEATSALDTENERRVQAAIDKVNEELEVTRVVIAHRLSTIQNADKIVMFDSGRIVDQGTHEELLQTNEKYRRDISNIEKDDKDINNEKHLENLRESMLIEELNEFLTESVSVSVSSDSENKIKDTNQEELRMMSGFQIVKRLLAYYRPSGLI